jgi:hypothetical protein
MISQSVPNNYTFSPSDATPHLTINHDVAADLDSSNAFEGTFAAPATAVVLILLGFCSYDTNYMIPRP